MNEQLRKWIEVADVLGYACEETARKRYRESLVTADPMPLVIDGKRIMASRQGIADWNRRRFERLMKEQLQAVGR